eukprot:TRINITY_DN35859_c2_g3_i1.p1 TRINITY_DN35859_c2_g3~~TRINITY_DN35859_c2_g3_i1.p1  ORF type:complete len:2293 (-),score=381.25 TRINITY_DN35859_c2_g3_i1:13-6108(-)
MKGSHPTIWEKLLRYWLDDETSTIYLLFEGSSGFRIIACTFDKDGCRLEGYIDSNCLLVSRMQICERSDGGLDIYAFDRIMFDSGLLYSGNSITNFPAFYEEFGHGQVDDFNKVHFQKCLQPDSFILSTPTFKAWISVPFIPTTYNKQWLVGPWTRCSNGIETRSLDCVSRDDNEIKFPRELCEEYGVTVPITNNTCVTRSEPTDAPNGLHIKSIEYGSYQQVLFAYADDVIFVSIKTLSRNYLQRCFGRKEEMDCNYILPTKDVNIFFKRMWMVKNDVYIEIISYGDATIPQQVFIKASVDSALNDEELAYTYIFPSTAVKNEIAKYPDTKFFYGVEEFGIVAFNLDSVVLVFSSAESHTIDTFTEDDLIMSGSNCGSKETFEDFFNPSHNEHIEFFFNGNLSDGLGFFIQPFVETRPAESLGFWYYGYDVKFVHCPMNFDDTNKPTGELGDQINHKLEGRTAPVQVAFFNDGTLVGMDANGDLMKLNIRRPSEESIVEFRRTISEQFTTPNGKLSGMSIVGNYYTVRFFLTDDREYETRIFSFDPRTLKATILLFQRGLEAHGLVEHVFEKSERLSRTELVVRSKDLDFVKEPHEYNWSIGDFKECKFTNETVYRSVECWNPFGAVVDNSLCEVYTDKPNATKLCEHSISEPAGWSNSPLEEVLFSCGDFIIGTGKDPRGYDGYTVERCNVLDKSGVSCEFLFEMQVPLASFGLFEEKLYFINLDYGAFKTDRESVITTMSKDYVCSYPDDDIPSNIYQTEDIPQTIADELEKLDIVWYHSHLDFIANPPALVIRERTGEAVVVWSLMEHDVLSLTESDLLLSFSMEEYSFFICEGLQEVIVGKLINVGSDRVTFVLTKRPIVNGTLGDEKGFFRVSDGIPEDDELHHVVSYNPSLDLAYSFTNFHSPSVVDPFKDIEVCEYDFDHNAKHCANLNGMINDSGQNGDVFICASNLKYGFLYCREVSECVLHECKTKMVHIYKVEAGLQLIHLAFGNTMKYASSDFFTRAFDMKDYINTASDKILSECVLWTNEIEDTQFIKLDGDLFQIPLLTQNPRWEVSEYSACIYDESSGDMVMIRSVSCVDFSGVVLNEEECTLPNPTIARECIRRLPITTLDIVNMETFVGEYKTLNYLCSYEEQNAKFYGVDNRIVGCFNGNCETIIVLENGMNPRQCYFNYDYNIGIIGSFGNIGYHDILYEDNLFYLFNPDMGTFEANLHKYGDIDVYGAYGITYKKMSPYQRHMPLLDISLNDSHFINGKKDGYTISFYATLLPNVSFDSRVTRSDEMFAVSVNTVEGTLTLMHSNSKLKDNDVYDRWETLETQLLEVDNKAIGSIDDFEVFIEDSTLFTLQIGDNYEGFSKRRLCRFEFDREGITKPTGECIDETKFLPGQNVACGISNDMVFCKSVSSACNESKWCFPTAIIVLSTEQFPLMNVIATGNSFTNFEATFESFSALDSLISPREFLDLEVEYFPEVNGQESFIIKSNFFGKSDIVLRLGAKWEISDIWSECSTSCGKGISSSTMICKRGDEIVSNDMCTQQKPADPTKECVVDNCFYWKFDENWSQCSELCDGISTRSVVCVDYLGEEVYDSKCLIEKERPPSSRGCNPQPCYQWGTTEWSKCSHICGNGLQTREKACYARGIVVDKNLCKGVFSESLNKSCNLGDCEWMCNDPVSKVTSSEVCHNCEYGSVWPVCCPARDGHLCGTGERECDESKKPEVFCKESSPCEGMDCGANGTCIYDMGSPAYCLCNIGYIGDKCDSHEESAVYYYLAYPWGTCSEDCGDKGIKSRKVVCRKNENGIITTEPSDSVNCNFDKPMSSTSCNRFACEAMKNRVKVSLSLIGENIQSMLLANRLSFETQLKKEIALLLGVRVDSVEILSISISGEKNTSELRLRQLTSQIERTLIKFAAIPEEDVNKFEENVNKMVTEFKDPESDMRTKSIIMANVEVDSFLIETKTDEDEDNGIAPMLFAAALAICIFAFILYCFICRSERNKVVPAASPSKTAHVVEVEEKKAHPIKFNDGTTTEII